MNKGEARVERGSSGQFREVSAIGGEAVCAFIPDPLPPDPPLAISPQLQAELDAAHLALGRLDALSTLLPDTGLFLYSYVRKEAVLSSQIEGTQSTLSDLLFYELDEAPGVPIDDVTEVSRYVRALELGVAKVRQGFPLAGRVLRELHAELLSEGRGSDRTPGEYRRTQNWIGGPRPGLAAFVPPPPDELSGCMGAFENFLHDVPHQTPTLLKAALAHAQFETIHPFLDGNGRLGRLLITLLLVRERVLSEPSLYLSLYLKRNKSAYYEHLQRVRTAGAWEDWIGFFVRGVTETAQEAVGVAVDLTQLVERDEERIRSLGRTAGSGLQVHLVLRRVPVQTSATLCKQTGLTAPTVNKLLDQLSDPDLPGGPIVREVTGRRRRRVFVYDEYLQRLSDT